MSKNVVKKLPFLIKYIADRYSTQGMCNKVILENSAMLMFITDCYKGQKMCNKTLDNYNHELRFFPN